MNKIYLGAFPGGGSCGELAEARRLWEEATRGGASASGRCRCWTRPRFLRWPRSPLKRASTEDKPG